jgi:hypothetical protein
MTLYFLNAPIVTNDGFYNWRKSSLPEISHLLDEQISAGTQTVSAIGHKATAEILSYLLNYDIPVNRIQVQMKKGDIAIVFKLKQRIEEGKVLSREEIEKVGYEFGILTHYGEAVID